MRNITPQTKQKLISIYPELQSWFDAKDTMSLSTAESLLIALLGKVKELKGDDGYTPLKGKDYFTNSEIEQIIRLTSQLATPIKGKDYFDGNDYVLTQSDKKEIAKSITVPIIDKIIEKTVEKTEVVKEVMPKSIDISIVKGAVSKKDLEITAKKIEDGMARVDGRIKLIDQRWHGGGLSRVSHDTTLSGSGTPADPLSVIGGTGSGFQKPITGALNQATFTWATAPNVIVVDNIPRQKIQSDGTVNWTGTTTTTLSIWPTYDIYASA